MHFLCAFLTCLFLKIVQPIIVDRRRFILRTVMNFRFLLVELKLFGRYYCHFVEVDLFSKNSFSVFNTRSPHVDRVNLQPFAYFVGTIAYEFDTGHGGGSFLS